MDGGAAALTDAGGAHGLLARIRAEVATSLDPIVEQIDHGTYPAQTMRALGRNGAFSAHLAAETPLPARDLGVAIEAMAAIGASCMSTAFCAWCQDACGWYLENSDNADLRARLQPLLAHGVAMGGTGLSNPVKALAGIEGFKLKAIRAERGYIVSGVLPWVSNLGEGHWFGTIFEDAADASHRLMAMVQCGQPGVEIRQNAHFIGLEGTGTYSVLFRRAFIADDMLLADPLADMARRIRPGFVLLQTGMGLGVIDGCVALMRAADRTHLSTNRFLPDRPDTIEAAADELRDTLMRLAATPTERDAGYMRSVLEARLATSELTLRATQSAVLHGGARGYLEGSAIARRQREGNFVALITPSVRHLRMELAATGAK